MRRGKDRGRERRGKKGAGKRETKERREGWKGDEALN